jgi:NADP-dependent 3-hydroxy acid dehydrogenase YdfG
MLLENKTAIIYGGGGAIGGAVARTFAAEGATVFLAGRTLSTLEIVADDIRAAGGKAETAVVDAFNAEAVERHATAVAERAGHIDISFNLVGLGDAQGGMLVDMGVEHFVMPVANAVRTHFLTATAAARHMAKRRSGVILALTAQAGRKPFAAAGGFGIACAAIEATCAS